MLNIFIRTDLIPIFFTNPILSGWMVTSLKLNVLFKYSMLEARRLEILGGGYLLNTLIFIRGGAHWLENLLLLWVWTYWLTSPHGQRVNNAKYLEIYTFFLISFLDLFYSLLTIFIRTGLIPIFLTSLIISGWMVSSLNLNVLFKDSIVEARRLKIWGGLSAEYINFYSWWSTLAGKLAVTMSIEWR